MLNQFFKLGLVLLLGLVLWGIQQRTEWDEDYSKYDAEIIDVPPLNINFHDIVDPKYFQNATMIKNETHMICPQDLAFAKDGTIYSGLFNGNIIEVSTETNETKIVGSFPGSGRIGSVILNKDETALYYVATKGLFKMNISTKQFEHIPLEGVNMGHLNSLVMDQENQILYLTDAGPIKFQFSIKILLLCKKFGKIIKYDLKTQKAQILLDNIDFPNGITYLSKTKEIVYSQFNRFTLWKYSLQTKKQTKLVDNLLGTADNLKISHDTGDILTAIFIARDRVTEFLKDKPTLRKAMMFIPERFAFAMTTKIAGGLRINPETGQIKQYLFGATTRSSTFSSLHQKDGKLYFSSVGKPSILIVDKNANKEEGKEGQYKARAQDL